MYAYPILNIVFTWLLAGYLQYLFTVNKTNDFNRKVLQVLEIGANMYLLTLLDMRTRKLHIYGKITVVLVVLQYAGIAYWQTTEVYKYLNSWWCVFAYVLGCIVLFSAAKHLYTNTYLSIRDDKPIPM
jgi:hypothetical protein